MRTETNSSSFDRTSLLKNMTIEVELATCYSLRDFFSFFKKLDWVYPTFGGRRACITGKKGTICMHDFVASLEHARFSTYFEPRRDESCYLAAELISKIRRIDQATLQESLGPNATLLRRVFTAIKKVFTYLARYFGNRHSTRDVILARMEKQIGYPTAVQIDRIMSIPSIVDSLCASSLNFPSPDDLSKQPSKEREKTLENLMRNIRQPRIDVELQKKELESFLAAKVIAHFGEPVMKDAFMELIPYINKFNWLVNFTVAQLKDQPRDALYNFFDRIEWPSAALKQQFLSSLFDQTAAPAHEEKKEEKKD